MVNAVSRFGFEDSHEIFRQSVHTFLEREVVPNHPKWESAGIVDRGLFLKAASAGLLGLDAPVDAGGGGSTDFRFNAIISEEAARLNVFSSVAGISLHNDICLPYFLEAATPEQQERWLPGICDGSLVTAVAMTEPGTGSDLSAIRTAAKLDGDEYVINGSKTFISNAFNADLVITAVRTDPTERHRGISLVVVETDRSGFERGRNLAKIGLHAQDTGELFFNDVRVPAANRLGGEGDGFRHLVTKLPRERLSVAIQAVVQAEAAFDMTLSYVKERKAFGQPIGSFQHNKFVLAEMRTELDLARTFVDQQIDALNRNALSAEAAASAKWWTTEMCVRVVDRCLQLHGGYGYMEEYPIAILYRDVRVMTIYGGTTQIMKEIIGRSLGL